MSAKKKAERLTREADVKRALARSGGEPMTAAQNRRRLMLDRVGVVAAKGGNSRGENGHGTERVSKSI